MQNKIYVDTNIVIDLCDSARSLHEKSFTFITSLTLQKSTEIFLNSDTLATLFYILSNRSTLNTEEVLEKMQFVHEIFTLVPVESEDVETALNLCTDGSVSYRDYEDTMQYVCAKKVSADVIVTNDKGFVSLDIDLVGTKA